MTGCPRGGDYRGGAVEGDTYHLLSRRFYPRDVMPPIRPQESQVIDSLPADAQEVVDYRFPDHLDIVGVRHSNRCWTVDVMDLDYKHYTFRLNLSLDGRWSLAPIAGFQYGTDLDLLEGGTGWQVSGS